MTINNDRSEHARRNVIELLDILEQLGQVVPFEVQTMFYRIWCNGIPHDPAMVDLARRMGFVEGWEERREERRTEGRLETLSDERPSPP